MEDLSKLTPEQRCERYFALAADAREHAEHATSDRMRVSYMLMAEQWEVMAEECRQLAKKLRELR